MIEQTRLQDYRVEDVRLDALEEESDRPYIKPASKKSGVRTRTQSAPKLLHAIQI